MSKLTLYVLDEAGLPRDATVEEILAGARSVLARSLRRGKLLESPRAVQDFLVVTLGQLPHEVFGILHLDNRHRLIEWQELFRGTLDGATVHPREVVKEALARNSAACVFVHNHPSGVSEPSQADELITRRLKEALALVDIRVLDHVIVAGGDLTSFAEKGLI
jgi:DNA repair protein RadC